ncbi:hypothetical protein J5N97_000398 [Dioscorea zingiberensis]|uniref:Protein kinase domain-containing protein n=1 Tax=Dioscorea zingiberensis TaxID=325984 RepID=A0A9D5BSU4_9LILI|nr:hypothetical protein J5N97_000398 [Dioscorea zingiberensis]
MVVVVVVVKEDDDPCSWFGVECSSDGKVISLNLKDLCLGGTLAPELGKLVLHKIHCFFTTEFCGIILLLGKIPREIGDLMELEVLDLGYNNFSGSFPSDFSNNLSLTTLLLDNNQFLGCLSPEVHELKMVSECQTDESQLTYPAFGTSCMSRIYQLFGFLDEDMGKVSNFHFNFLHVSVLNLMKYVSGVPKLNRSELVAACEDFSNIIGCFSDVKEAEHLDWGMRLRIAMGMAYCLEYMHQMTPPILQKNLQSASIYLTEDYAAKISDFSFWNEGTAAKTRSADKELMEVPCASPESNVYSFGVILFEMFTGRIPYSVDEGSLVDWASHYLRGRRNHWEKWWILS